jgi:signal transduction histidine kinase
MAHEARGPLNAIAIHAELVEARAGKLGAEEAASIRRSLEVMRAEVERIDAILGEYLRHVGPRETKRRSAPVDEVLLAATRRMRRAAAARGVELRLEPPAERSARRAWPIDADAIGIALDELLANALDASRPGGAITLRAQANGEGGTIEVTDDGEGMAPEMRKRAFGIGVTTRAGRAGLGLSLAKQIVKGHGGSIAALSDGPGRGTVVRIELPLD